jgi:hypothetical protein
MNGATFRTSTWQHARTLDDPREIKGDCEVAAIQHAVTGHMVQAGFVPLGSSNEFSS